MAIPLRDRHAATPEKDLAMPAPDNTPRQQTRAQPTNVITAEAATAIADGLNAVVADLFALYVKTKNFHWHITGPHFRDHHQMLDDQGTQLLETIDPAAERVRKLGRTTLRSVGHIARLQRIADNDADNVTPTDMLTTLRDDNLLLVNTLRDLHDICDRHNDIATASLIENWIDEADGRIWFLAETAA
jgi:starvation-inducible DNA-binding protein